MLHTCFIARKIERSSPRASACGSQTRNASRNAETFHNVCTTTLTKQECCPVLFSNPGAAATATAVDTSSALPAAAVPAAATFPLRLLSALAAPFSPMCEAVLSSFSDGAFARRGRLPLLAPPVWPSPPLADLLPALPTREAPSRAASAKVDSSAALSADVASTPLSSSDRSSGLPNDASEASFSASSIAASASAGPLWQAASPVSPSVASVSLSFLWRRRLGTSSQVCTSSAAFVALSAAFAAAAASAASAASTTLKTSAASRASRAALSSTPVSCQ
mmetsp:Transcript_16022/g.38014  ORF Transcript_16022/g.38014 Transcript_16022/m.38014 type:complete len:278 (+) Transcript_16022:1099-1932(+)